MIDLRSDTVTLPSEGMRQAMARAEVGDDVYGEDPTVARLEERVAALLGKEAAVFTPSGTMANQIAIGAQAGPGDEVIAAAGSHVIAYEGGAISALWGAQAHPIETPKGIFRPAQLQAAIRPSGMDHLPVSRLVCVENTHNRGGGSIWSAEELREVGVLAHRLGLSVHLDGARLWNAAIATGQPLQIFAETADTVSVCLSKGLGAPAGSVVATSADLAPKLRRLRKRLGGGMRQAGVLAAAGLWALDHNLDRLAEDHANAKRLAHDLQAVDGLRVEEPETNLVFVGVPGDDAEALLAELRSEGVLAGADGPSRIRLVTHLGVDEAACRRAASVIASRIASRRRS